MAQDKMTEDKFESAILSIVLSYNAGNFKRFNKQTSELWEKLESEKEKELENEYNDGYDDGVRDCEYEN